MHGNRVFLHYMFDFRDRRVGDQFLERKNASQALVIIHYIDIIDFVHILRLLAHLIDTFGHTPILVHHNHLGTHQTTGSIFVILQQVDDISSLLDVLDVRKNFFLRIFVQLTHQVNRIIGIHVVYKAFGDELVRKFFQ